MTVVDLQARDIVGGHSLPARYRACASADRRTERMHARRATFMCKFPQNGYLRAPC